MTDIIAPLSVDEHTVLELANRGQAMLAIGHWEKPTLALYERGLLNQQTDPGGGPSYFITYYGKPPSNPASRAPPSSLPKRRGNPPK